ncbi:MAG TPA: glutamate-5-semialdehyde dehydrogenase [Vitreimonas sp.]|uniref:glutamate-5-semialdehyde dehydrogenase n=1 Tax=Vitreimonas sp. TaxID=3069702 RepID=UPI002D29FA75|nr:glutamate-5-semialdehyde dehydrogenase [Vitreimonas sp.]HYD89715.1 glutamate-5-semialdehyde dehydrogenase [Vitreimonas sp.]
MEDGASLLFDEMRALGQSARKAARAVAAASSEQRSAALREMAAQLRARQADILDANTRDVAAARQRDPAESFIDRLMLDEARLDSIAAGIETIAALPDPVGATMEEWTRPNGLRIARVRTPIGVIGMIFESRPNVAADAAALALRAGNAIILRGGSDSAGSVRAIGGALQQALGQAQLAEDAIQIVQSTDRAAVGMMLQGLGGAIDVIVPRGGKSLVARVQAEARIPVFAHLEGVNHTYVHAAADVRKAVDIVVNAKMRRVSVCGATEKLLIDRAVLETMLPPIAKALEERGCELRGGPEAQRVYRMKRATSEDWSAEYLAPIIAIRTVADIDEAIAVIGLYGSQHTDAIVTEDKAAAEKFLRDVDSAIVLHNASTQFADGGEFGFGGEIGIATGRLHARGPVGAEQLTTFKYVVRGNGQIRP